MEYFLESKKTDNFVRVKSVNQNTVEIVNYYIDNDDAIEFCELIKCALNQAEKDGYEYFIQCVDKFEWNENLKNNDMWEIIKEEEDFLTISCSISDAPQCILIAFIKEQHKL